jgi:hypothetical protein
MESDDELYIIINKDPPPPIVASEDYVVVDEFIGSDTEEEAEYDRIQERLKNAVKNTKRKRRSKFLNLALDVFRNNKTIGLTVNRIWEKRNLSKKFKSKGKTPKNTLSSTLHAELKREDSLFYKINSKFFIV